MSRKPTNEHCSVKAKRLDELPQSQKDFLVSLYREGSVHRIDRFAQEYNVVYATLIRRIKYWEFEKLNKIS